MSAGGLELLLDRYRADALAEGDRLQQIVDRLAAVPSAAFGRATALFGLRHAEATLAWCDEMRAALPELRHHGRRMRGRPPRKELMAPSGS